MKIKINDVELIQGVYVKAASDEVKDNSKKYFPITLY